MNISIIIPNYNGEKLLKKNLPAVLSAAEEYKKGKVEIIIPDDPSTDESNVVIRDFIAQIDNPNIKGLTVSNRIKSKSGFGNNVNRGVEISTGEILILLNSDVCPKKNFLEPLLSHFIADNVFAVGCLDESIEQNGGIIKRGRGLGWFERGLLNHRKGDINSEDTFWVSGGSGAFRRSMWDKLGGLDSIYDPFYWEDIDLSYRAQKAGYKILFEEKSVVIHKHEEGVVKERFEEKYVRKIAYRNQIIFIWKNITDKNLLRDHFIWLPYNITITFFKGDAMFLLGFFEALLMISKILKHRKEAKKMFKRSDYELLNLYLANH